MPHLARFRLAPSALLATILIGGATALAAGPAEAPFLVENDAAMTRMMAADGGGALESLAAFTTNPAGSAIVNALGPIRQVVQGEHKADRRYLVIASGTADQHGAPVQVQAE
jgi:hypothetical protein